MTGEYTPKGNTCLRRFMGCQDEESVSRIYLLFIVSVMRRARSKW